MKNLYKYYITNGVTTTEVFPRESHTLSYALEEGAYKLTSSTVQLHGDDYDLIKSYGRCSETYFEVWRQSDSTKIFEGKVVWKKDNERTKIIEFEPNPEDDLDLVINNASINVNMLQSKVYIEYLILFTSLAPASIPGWTKFSTVFNLEGSDFDVFMCFRSKYPLDATSELYNSAFYATPYDTFQPTFQNDPVNSPPSGFVTIQPYENDIENLGTFYYTFVKESELQYKAITGRVFKENFVSYKQGASLKIVMQDCIAAIPSSLAIKSSFLFGDAVESGSSWSTASIGGYDIQDLQLHSVSDLQNIDADQPATQVNITLNSILNTLKLLNCYWFIDEDGNFRVEHISYRRESGTVDYRAIESQRGIKVVDKLQVTEEGEDGSEGKISLKGLNAYTSEYLEKSIIYEGACADIRKSKSLSADLITFDYLEAIQADSRTPIDGIVLVSASSTNEQALDNLETANIITSLWVHESNYDQFKIDGQGSVINAVSLAYAVSVEEVNYPEVELPFDPNKSFQTYYDDGNSLGICESAEIDTFTGNVAVQLKFERV